MNFAQKVANKIYRSPAAKTAIPILCSLGVGVFSNFLVTEMNGPNGIQWGSFYRKASFYLLLLFTALTYLFHRYLYVHEADVMQFADIEYCRAYALSELIPKHLEAAKNQIASGNTKSFKDAMDQLEKVLK